MNLFKELSEQEQSEYRDWARRNYEPFSEINGTWHPVVQQECVKINQEKGMEQSPVNKQDLIVSNDEFLQYIKVQRGGRFNMFDPRARQHTSLTKEQWIHIMENYDYLTKLYKLS
jgi:hypothetical protein